MINSYGPSPVPKKLHIFLWIRCTVFLDPALVLSKVFFTSIGFSNCLAIIIHALVIAKLNYSCIIHGFAFEDTLELQLVQSKETILLSGMLIPNTLPKRGWCFIDTHPVSEQNLKC